MGVGQQQAPSGNAEPLSADPIKLLWVPGMPPTAFPSLPPLQLLLSTFKASSSKFLLSL